MVALDLHARRLLTGRDLMRHLECLRVDERHLVGDGHRDEQLFVIVIEHPVGARPAEIDLCKQVGDARDADRRVDDRD